MNRFLRSPWNKSDREGNRGVAMIVVMFVIATLTILVLEFVHSTRINLYIAGNIANGMKAFYLTRSGVAVAAGAMLDDLQDNKEDHLWENWAQALPALPAGEGWVTVEIIDEASKFNLNRLVRKSGLPDSVRQEVLRKLLLNLELDPELVNPIIDWIDEDDEGVGGTGQETGLYGYNSGIDAYPSKNAPIASMDEILMISRITPEIFEKLKPNVTIYGGTKLNLNTVEEPVLQAYVQVLTGEDNSTAAQDIIAWRETEDNYFKVKDIRQRLTTDVGIDAALAKKLEKHFGADSQYFSVKVEATVADSVKRCVGVIQRNKKSSKIIYFRPL